VVKGSEEISVGGRIVLRTSANILNRGGQVQEHGRRGGGGYAVQAVSASAEIGKLM